MKLIHIADLHLGRTFNTSDPEFNHKRREELFETFENVLKYARDKGIYNVLISGDFYEDETCTYKEIKKIVGIIEKYDEINIYIIAGNHDPLDESSWYKRISWPQSVNILRDENDKIIIDEVAIYGLSWKQKLWMLEEVPNFDVDDRYFNIIMLHGDIKDSKSNYFAINIESYLNLGFDYLALGHIHKPQVYKNYAYPGSLEPMKYANNESHGFLVIDTKSNCANLEFVSFAKRDYKNIEILVDRDENIDSIENKCKDRMEQIGCRDDIYRIKFKGIARNSIIEAIKERLEKHYYKIDAENETIGVTEILDYDDPLFERVEKELSREDYSPEMKKRIEEIVLTALIKTGRA